MAAALTAHLGNNGLLGPPFSGIFILDPGVAEFRGTTTINILAAYLMFLIIPKPFAPAVENFDAYSTSHLLSPS
jgi:hypothetical protein